MSTQQDIADAEAFKRLGSMEKVLEESRTTIKAGHTAGEIKFEYSKWRHGGWYVHNVRYPSGAIGCVSRNYADGKWRIACDLRPFDERPTFKNRDAAAMAELALTQQAES